MSTTLSTRGSLNLGLLVLVVILIHFALDKPDETPLPATHITGLPPGAISSVRIERVGQTDIELARRGGRWWVTAPLEIPANVSTVSSLLALAGQSAKKKYAADDLELSKYGLDLPLSTVFLGELAIAFGITNPVTRRQYVLINDIVYLLEELPVNPLHTEINAYVSTRLIADGKIVNIAFPDYRLTKDDKDNWLFYGTEHPKQQTASALAKLWQTANAFWIEPYSADVDYPIVAVLLESGEQLNFDIISAEPEPIFARRDLGLSYHLRGDFGLIKKPLAADEHK